ncbi:MAG: cell wall-active antibiotics response protein [Bacteroidetes bacterium]|jgi:hypothetical protein|nr:cell wall-active antibiotics response protein [Bacteroidota bacterium]
MKNSLRYVCFALASILAASLHAQPVTKQFSLTNEREMTVIIDVSFGTLVFERAPEGMVAVVRYDDNQDDRDRLNVQYESGSRGKLRIRSKSSSTVFQDKERHINDRRIIVQFSDRVPISFDVELGAGSGDFDLTGLKVQELRISTGASDVHLRCDEPNPITADNVEIESGVSKFTADGLSNLNFRRMAFSGGIGSYRLDFSGELANDAEATIDVGLGSIVVEIPEPIHARVRYDDGWFSQFSLAGDFKRAKSGVYETDGYGDSGKRLDIRIDSGLGSVKIRR